MRRDRVCVRRTAAVVWRLVIDNDGDLDALIVNLNEPPSLLRNDVSGGGHWLKVKLTGDTSNRSAIGAQVLVRYGTEAILQEVLSQSSFFSCNESRLHFGLGKSTMAEVSVRWPSGKTSHFEQVAANGVASIHEKTGLQFRAWSPTKHGG